MEVLDAAMPIPPAEPERPPAAGPADWVRRNLFRSVGDGIVTVVAGLVVLFVLYRAVRFVFGTGRWEIVKVNLRLFLVGRYPVDELWRIVLGIAVMSFFVGLVAGFIARRREITGTANPRLAERPWWRSVLETALRL